MLSNMWCSSSTFPVTSNSPLARSSCRRSSLGVYSRVWSILLGFRDIHLEQAFAGLLVISRFDEGYVLGLVSLRTWLHSFRIWSCPPCCVPRSKLWAGLSPVKMRRRSITSMPPEVWSEGGWRDLADSQPCLLSELVSLILRNCQLLPCVCLAPLCIAAS